jgi:hypothetical protein
MVLDRDGPRNAKPIAHCSGRKVGLGVMTSASQKLSHTQQAALRIAREVHERLLPPPLPTETGDEEGRGDLDGDEPVVFGDQFDDVVLDEDADAEEINAAREAQYTDAMLHLLAVPPLDDTSADKAEDFLVPDGDFRLDTEAIRKDGGVMPERVQTRDYNWRRHCVVGGCPGRDRIHRGARIMASGRGNENLLEGLSIVPDSVRRALVDLAYERRVLGPNSFSFDGVGQSDGDVEALMAGDLLLTQRQASQEGMLLLREWEPEDDRELVKLGNSQGPRWSVFGREMLRDPCDCFRRFLDLFGRYWPVPGWLGLWRDGSLAMSDPQLL